MLKDKYAIVLVDDSVDDRLFMRLALERSSLLQVVAEVNDGQEAIDYLKGEGRFHDRSAYPWPDMLVVDLKMPRKNGFDVLEWISHEQMKDLATVILSGARLEEDVNKSMALGACGYFKKTGVRQEQEEIVRSLEQMLLK